MCRDSAIWLCFLNRDGKYFDTGNKQATAQQLILQFTVRVVQTRHQYKPKHADLQQRQRVPLSTHVTVRLFLY